MDKKEFNKITKEEFLEYGFIKRRETFVLVLDEITIDCRLYTWNYVRSFNYWISINGLHDDSEPYEKRTDVYCDVKMKHSPSAEGYHSSEIKYEEYTEDQYRKMLKYMLHFYFDPYKQDARHRINENIMIDLKPKAAAFLGVNGPKS